MKSTGLFRNIERLFFGFGPWLRRISLFCSLRVHFRDLHLALEADSEVLRTHVRQGEFPWKMR